MRVLGAAVAVCMTLTSAVMAATVSTDFSYAGTVTSQTVSSSSGFSFGNFGDAATIKLKLTADPTMAIPSGFMSGGAAQIQVAGSDFIYDGGFVLDGFNDGFNDSIAVTNSYMFIATSSGFVTWPGEAGNTLRTSLRVDFGTALSSAPTTYGDLVAALSAQGSSASFLTNGDFLFDAGGGTTEAVFDEFRVEARAPVPVVPLPAGGVLILSGLVGLLSVGRKRRD